MGARKPNVSVVVVVHNIPREIPRTLLSLSASYQRHMDAEDYEVIVVDNGSSPALDTSLFNGLQGNFRLLRIDDAPPSPALAINTGLMSARGDVIGVMIDGARMVTPGLLHFAHHGAQLYEHAIVATLGWHLGLDSSQRAAMDAGYTQLREDALLARINWPSDGYRLFEVAAPDSSSTDGWLSRMSESNGLFLRRRTWDELGPIDLRFDSPGGGLLNLDLFRRAVELPDARLVVLLAEATFHQLHGGVATNHSLDDLAETLEGWGRQYASIRSEPWQEPRFRDRPTLLGVLPRAALSHFTHSALFPAHWAMVNQEPPLGTTFDPDLWSMEPAVRPKEPGVAALVELAHREFRAGRFEATAAVARLARLHAPDEVEPQRLLAYVSRSLPTNEASPEHRVGVHIAMGDAHRILGDVERSAEQYRAALTLEPGLVTAHAGLSALRMPGNDYYWWLDRLQAEIRPETYLEIGVASGRSLALARPPTLAIGVDPEPKFASSLKVETHIFAESSDEFFARCRLEPILDGRPLRLAFVDGLHRFEQALRDFINLERFCGPSSAILIHDTLPLDEATQTRERQTEIWTGDVWKIVLCLKHFRPDLDIFTIETPPTGLTVVLGLDPSSRVLANTFDEIVARFINTPFNEIETRLYELAGAVPNDWELVATRLRRSGVL